MVKTQLNRIRNDRKHSQFIYMKADKWSKCNYLSFITNTDGNNYYYEVKRGLIFFIWMKTDRSRGVIVTQIDITLLSNFAYFSDFV